MYNRLPGFRLYFTNHQLGKQTTYSILTIEATHQVIKKFKAIGAYTIYIK